MMLVCARRQASPAFFSITSSTFHNRRSLRYASFPLRQRPIVTASPWTTPHQCFSSKKLSNHSDNDSDSTSHERTNARQVSYDNDESQEAAGHDTTTARVLCSSVFPLLFDAVGLTLGGIVLALSFLYVKQDNLLYIPEIDGITRNNGSNPRGYQSPAEYGIPFETHMIGTTSDDDDGISIHSWLLLHPPEQQSKHQESLPTIIFFHGNAGNIGLRLPNALELYNLKANVFMVEYRGYGESLPANVRPSEVGIKNDCGKALQFISQHSSVDPSRLFIFGRSLGGSVGFHVAQFAQEHSIPLAGLIVENTFVSIDRMVDVLLPFLSPFKRLLLKNHYDSSKIVPQLAKVPILYLAGDADEIVPHSQMMELYSLSQKTTTTSSSCPSSTMARIHIIKGGMHNDTWLVGGKAYWNAIRDFIYPCETAAAHD